jgi:hypothetical protein
MIREAYKNYAVVAAMNNVTSSNLFHVSGNTIMKSLKKLSQIAVTNSGPNNVWRTYQLLP